MLSFLSGLAFHDHEPVKSVLDAPGPDLETKIEGLVFEAGALLENQYLMDVADTIEVIATYDDGRMESTFYRSGRSRVFQPS